MIKLYKVSLNDSTRFHYIFILRQFDKLFHDKFKINRTKYVENDLRKKNQPWMEDNRLQS